MVQFVEDRVTEGGLHLCLSQPCAPTSEVSAEAVHVTRVRCWRIGTFKADYLTDNGKKAMKDALAAEKEKLLASSKAKAKSTPGAGKKKAKGEADPNKLKKDGKKPAARPRASRKKPGGAEVIDLASEEEIEDEEEVRPAGVPADREHLRDLFSRAKDRMVGRTAGRIEEEEEGALAGGTVLRPRGRAREEMKLVSGTHLRPGLMTPLAIEDRVVSRDGHTSSSKKRKNHKSPRNTSELLLEQAAQAEESRSSRKKKKSKGEGKLLNFLRKAVGGKKKKRDKRKKRRKKEERKKMGIKKESGDPGDSDGEESESSESSSSSSSSDEEGSKSDLSYEPPLRRKALSSPGSVMEDLIRHAQEQMDRGALLDQDGVRAGVTQGIKMSTYFALLIRPYYPAGNPLLRELYALAQAIDLLRMGRLAETADALASRFVAVHTAMSDGNWQTAAQLELFPLEQVQSASTSVMLKAQKHRRLLWKSQGFTSRQARGKGGWWRSGGDEKGSEKGSGKGKKGKSKHKGKGSAGGEGSWKGDSNPWKENKDEPPKKN